MSIASTPIGSPIAGGVILAKANHISAGGACMAVASLVWMSTMTFVGTAGAVVGGTSPVTRTTEIREMAARPCAVGGGVSGIRQLRNELRSIKTIGGGESSVVQQYLWVRAVTSDGGASVGGAAACIAKQLHVSTDGAVVSGISPQTIHTFRSAIAGAVIGGATTATAHTPIYGTAGAVMTVEHDLSLGYITDGHITMVASGTADYYHNQNIFHVGNMLAGVTGGGAEKHAYYLRPSLNIWYFSNDTDVIYIGDI